MLLKNSRMKSFMPKNTMVFIIAIVASITGLLMGFDTGVISGALGFISKTFHLSKQQYVLKEFIVSSVPIGALIGALVSSFCVQRVGRKYGIAITAVLFVIGSLLTAIAIYPSMVIIGRLIMGFAVGLSSMVAPMYLSEISPPKTRGSIVFLFQLSVTLGLLLAFIINYIFAIDENWRLMFIVGLVLGVLLAIGIIFLPESPRWLLQVGKEEEAMKALIQLREPNIAKDEFNKIKQMLTSHKKVFNKLFKHPFYLLMLFSCSLFMFQQLTGVNTIFYYSATIFKLAGYQHGSSSILASVVIGIINVISTLIAIFLVDYLGRRKLLNIGFIGMIITLSLLGLYYLKIFPPTATYIPLMSVSLFVFFFAISLGGIPYVMMSEIFPLEIRHMGMAAAAASNWGFNIIVSSTFLSLIHLFSIGYTFLLYASLTIIGFIFSYIFTPETKGISLEDIENHLYEGKPLRYIGKM